MNDEGSDPRTSCTSRLQVSAPFTPMEAWTQYKYVLELDGGSSTWRFKNALLGGFVVFKVDSDDQQCARTHPLDPRRAVGGWNSLNTIRSHTLEGF